LNTVFQNFGFSPSINGQSTRLPAVRRGVFAHPTHRGRLGRRQQTEPVYIIRQIPQSNLGRSPRGTDRAHDQASGPLALFFGNNRKSKIRCVVAEFSECYEKSIFYGVF